MSEMFYSVEDIKELMRAIDKYKISGLKIRGEEFKLEISGGRIEHIAAVPDQAALSGLPAPSAEYGGNTIKSPIVGTFYAAPSPDREPYVRPGTQVKKGDVLFIIESMKLMNEVTSEQDGIIAEILVENGQGVEYGQPIMRIE